MSVQIRVFVLVCVVVLIFGMMNMVRNKKLDLKYAFPWLFLGVGVGVLAVFDEFTARLAVMLGVEIPSNMIFFLGFCFSLTIIFCLTFAVSRLSYQVKRLTQECALLEKRLEELENCASKQKAGVTGMTDAAADGENMLVDEKLPTGGDAL